MYRSFAYPIANKPDNKSWTGFQFIDGDSGYIVLFREIQNRELTNKIKLKKMLNCRLQTVDVITGDRQIITVNNEGCAEFTIAEPCNFLWLKY